MLVAEGNEGCLVAEGNEGYLVAIGNSFFAFNTRQNRKSKQ